MGRKYRKRWYIGALLVILTVGAGMAVYMRDTPKTKVIFIAKTSDESDFWTSIGAGARMAAKDYDLEYEMMAPVKETNYKRQNELIADAIGKHPDVIALVPADYRKTAESAKKIKAAGIKLVLIDSKLEDGIADCIVSTDNVDGGRKVGQYMGAICNEDEKIGIVSHVEGNSTALEREQGIREGLGDKAKNIVDVIYGESDYNIAYSETKKMLKRHPGITKIAATNEYATVGAGRAVTDMGMKKSVEIVGFDSSMEEIRMLESGVVEGSVIQRPFEMGYLGIQAAADLAKGKSVEVKIDSGSKLITKKNIYTKENQKMLFPFKNN